MQSPGVDPENRPGVGQIAAGRRAFLNAFERRDAVAAAALYASEARLVAPSSAVLCGREAIERYWRAGLETGLAAIDLRPLEVRVAGNVAYEIGQYKLQVVSPTGERVSDHGRYLILYGRDHDGVWRRTVEMLNPDEPPERHGIGPEPAQAPTTA